MFNDTCLPSTIAPATDRKRAMNASHPCLGVNSCVGILLLSCIIESWIVYDVYARSALGRGSVEHVVLLIHCTVQYCVYVRGAIGEKLCKLLHRGKGTIGDKT
eukprot:3182978-Amphidinium_carterae.1